MSKILSVILRMDSTTGSPRVRFGTKWLSMTSTCIASELGTDSMAVCRFAKSADKMLGMILTATDPTLVLPTLPKVGRKHGVSAVAVRPELQVGPEFGSFHVGQQLSRWNHLDISAYGEGFVKYVSGFPPVGRTGHVADDPAQCRAVDR